MKTLDLFGKGRTVFSAELFPPKKSGNLETVIRALRGIKAQSPDFVSITYGAGGRGGETTADVASIAKDAFDMEVAAHLTAVNMTVEKLENQLDILKRKGVDNILVLRGDIVEDSAFYDFSHATDLALYIKKHHPAFHLIGAAYPEKHPESPCLEKDVEYMKLKEDSGIEQFITQLFFDNGKFLTFRDKARAAGITSPIDAGIMPVFSKNIVDRMIRLSNAHLPEALREIIGEEGDIYEKGIAFAVKQIRELVENGADGIHLYSMNRADVTKDVFEVFKDYRGL